MLHGKNYIGNSLSSTGKVTFKTFNPQLNRNNGCDFTEATLEEVNSAVNLAYSAFLEYKNIDSIKRSQFLDTIVDQILLIDNEIIKVYCEETGLAEGRAKGELARTIGQIKSFSELLKKGDWVNASIDTANPERKPVAKPDLRKMSIALGPVVVFGASNFPLAYSTAGGDTASALAAGCPVIVKSHPMHAGTGELISSAIIKAVSITAMPNGVFSNINSGGIQTGIDLVKNPLIKAVGFTGSLKAGRSLLNLANDRNEPIPVFAEMGSINPVIILPEILESDWNDLADKYAHSITLGSGQFCTNPGIIIGIKSDYFTQFVNSLSKKILDISPTCMLHPNILKNFDKNKNELISNKNIKVVADFNKEVDPNYSKQTIAMVNGSDFIINNDLQEEIFGPFSLLVECDDMSQLKSVVKEIKGQLTGTIIATDNEILLNGDLIDILKERVGRIIYNGVPTGVEVCPSMLHGGPYPASTDSRFTAVGIKSIDRWIRPFSYQDFPDELLPKPLQDNNPTNILRLVNGVYTKNKI
ncbi:aldehyde dehydrogenase (NADP(+)) [Flavobacteriaceae bacterium]|jgi:2,5-dioxopentanoate dehydrogenase|nr:aldehyde dehydrogenase (NADP(+)) [Flavobacteriaceae bacterium]